MIKPYDITGQKYNRLTVIGLSHKDGKRYKWLCRCDCGNEITARADMLKNGDVKSCGCLNREVCKSFFLKPMVGKKFGRLFVLEQVTFENPIKYKCLCDCGNYATIPGGSLRNGHTTSCGCYNRELRSKIMTRFLRGYRKAKGKNPDIPLLTDYELVRADYQGKGIAQKILKRDNYTCQMCGNTSDRGKCGHHIIPRHIDDSLYLVETNIITLCSKCHSKAHNNSNWKSVDIVIQKQLQEKIKVIYTCS